MSTPTNNSQFWTMLLILLSLFIFIFFTKGYYSDLIMTMSVAEENAITHENQNSELKLLETKQKELQKLEGSNNNEIWKYLQQLNEDEVIEEIYGFATNYSKNGEMKIISMNMWIPIVNELWFNESTVAISARVENKEVMTDFIDFLIEDSKYKFFLNSFTVPSDKDQFFNIQVPLTLYYKEIKQSDIQNKTEADIEE